MTVEPGKGRVDFETAAQHATARVPVLAPQQPAGEVRGTLAGGHYDCASHLVVCEDGRFLGMLGIETLLAAPAHASMASLMDREAPVVAPGLDQEIAAWHAVRSGASALAVVDAQGRFAGLIPPARLVEVLLSEHDEDLARAGGFMKSTASAREISLEPARRRFVHRLPWLLIGLAGAMLAADLVGWFETQLERKVVLAFFIPGIVYMADAVGTQTETIVVRGLSVGVPMRRMVARELLAGLAIGIAIGLASVPLVWWRWGDAELALAVGLSLCAACSTASVVAMALPWLFDAFDVDPAFGSGPLATVVQDLLSIWIYFLVATAVIR